MRAGRGLGTIAAGVLAALVVGAPAAARPFTGRGGGGGPAPGGGGTIGLVVLSGTDGLPHFGGKVTFSVSTSATSEPWVTLSCYQNGRLVYKASNGIFSTSLGTVFTLASNSWTGGAADCTAWLQNWDRYARHGTIQNLVSMSFHVYA